MTTAGPLPRLLLSLSGLCPLLANALSVDIYMQLQPVCNRECGWLYANTSGGVPPYTYAWSHGATTQEVKDLPAGTYTVTVTDATMETATDTYVLNALPNYGNGGGIGPYQFSSVCEGQGTILMFYTGVDNYQSPPNTSPYGPAPYTFDVVGNGSNLMQSMGCSGPTVMNILHLPQGTPGQLYTVNYADADGCQGSITYPSAIPIVWPQFQLLEVTGTCAGSTTGTATVAITPQSSFFGQPYGLYVRPVGITDVCQFQLDMWYSDADQTATAVFDGLAPGDHYLVWTTDPNDYYRDYPLYLTACKDSILFNVPALPGGCGVLSGTAFVDANGNCTLNPGENRVSGAVLEITPGPFYTTTNNDGSCSIVLPSGSYSIAATHPALTQSCPANATVNGNTNAIIPFGAPQGLDVMSSIATGPARPGFQHRVSANVRNLTANAPGTVTITLTFDPALSFVSANITPSSVAGNVITWTGFPVSLTQAYQERDLRIDLQVPPDVGLLGTELTHTITVTTQNTDTDLGNNTATATQTVTGSYDPNDKLANTSNGNTAVWQLGEDDWIDYTIRFQNTGTDTAFNVIITDTLPATLDPSTILWGTSSHAHSRSLLGGGILKYIFPNILLPDSNVNEPRSHGFVSFRIRPHEGLAVGQQITNIANIYFDFNPPVITEPSVLNVVSPIRLDARAWLGGAYDTPTAAMRDDLRAQALVPLTEPYTALGYIHSGEGGGESITPALRATTGPTAIVDWVILELRDPAQSATVLHSRSALLRRDGRITDKDGTSPVAFNAPVGNYRIALRHRNHLGVVSAAPVALGSTSTTWDARTTATALFGTAPTIINGTTRLLWPGDGNRDGIVRYAGASNDRDPILQAIGGSVPTAVINEVYNTLDVNLDGSIKYAGTTNDRDIILQTIGGVVPTAVRVQQVP